MCQVEASDQRRPPPDAARHLLQLMFQRSLTSGWGYPRLTPPKQRPSSATAHLTLPRYSLRQTKVPAAQRSGRTFCDKQEEQVEDPEQPADRSEKSLAKRTHEIPLRPRFVNEATTNTLARASGKSHNISITLCGALFVVATNASGAARPRRAGNHSPYIT